MPVVEKIEDLGFRVDICENIVDVFKRTDDEIAYHKGGSKINAVYSACLKFIQWHNEQIKQPMRP